MRLTDRRRGVGKKAVDIYEGCVTLEFTETADNNVRAITADNNKVLMYLSYFVIDGIQYEPVKNYSHSFNSGKHKIGWKMDSSIVRQGVLAATCPSTSFSADSALVTIPSHITEIESMAMRGMPASRPMQGVICYAVNPPTAVDLSIAIWYLQQSGAYLYVPAESVEAYKVAEGWSQYASQIVAI